LLGIPLVAAVAFGALISATDPVAVIAFFRSLGVSKRLAVLVEGESLFNDGTAIVIFLLAVGLGTSGASFSLPAAVFEFLRVSLGGLGVGLVLALAANYLIFSNVDDRLIETTVSMALAFGVFVIAEQFHLSGILAVVAAGVYLGNAGPQHMSPTTKNALYSFWEFLAFVTTSVLFLIVGLEIHIDELVGSLWPILVAVLAILISRALVVYGMAWFSNLFGYNISRSYRHVMFWGGLRGAISLALVLSLRPQTFGPGVTEQLRLMTFGVVLFTLLVQGVTMEPLLKWLRLAQKPEHLLEQQRRLGRLYAGRAGHRELDRLHRTGALADALWESLSRQSRDAVTARSRELQEFLAQHPELERELFLQTREAVLKSERSALAEAVRNNLISEAVFQELVRDVDERLAALDLIEAGLINPAENRQPHVIVKPS
jgi:monovalent cation:H+ antiporter, CPA1 family